MNQTGPSQVQLTSDQLDGTVERLSLRFAAQGFLHPRVAAVAITMRGIAGVELSVYAERVGVSVDVLRRIEAGELAAPDVPSALLAQPTCLGLRI